MSKPASDGASWPATLIALPLLIVAMGAVTLWEAYALQLSWGWLAVPAGLPNFPLRVWFLCSAGLSTVTRRSRKVRDGEEWDHLKRGLAASVVSPAVLIAVAALARWVLP